MSVKLKVAILALFLFVQNSIAVKDDGICTIDNVSDDDFKGALVLDEPVKKSEPVGNAIPIKEGIIYKGNDVTGFKCKEKCYISAKYDNSIITFTVGEEMANVDEYHFTDNIFKVETLFEITCSDGKTRQLRVQIPVTDVNENEPKFNIEDKTVIQFPVPVATSTFLTWYYTTEIIVTDEDFSNKGITVAADNDDVEVGYLTQEKKKVSITLKFKKIYTKRDEMTLKLTATDQPGNGDQPLNSKPLTLILKPDLENSPLPEFKKHEYECEFKNGKLTETIQLEGKTGKNVEVSVTDANGLFEGKLNDDQKTFVITRTTKAINVDSTILTIQIKRGELTEETKLLVNFLINVDPEKIDFTEKIYNYINNEAKKISPQKFFEPVSLTEKLEDVVFSVTPADGITATLNKDGQSVDFQITDDFQKKHKDEKLVELTLKAYKGDIKAETAVIVEIPNNLFKQPSYTLIYNPKSKSVTGEISTNSDVKGMEFTLSSSEGKDDNFKITTSGKSVTISLSKDKFVKYTSNVFTLTLSATSGGKAIAEAAVLVELPENSFSKTNYIAVYSETDKKIYGVDFISNELDVLPDIDDAELTKTFELKQHQKKSKLTGFPQSHFIKLFEKFNQGEMDKFLYKYMADEVKEFELSSKTDLSKDLPQGTNLTIPIIAKTSYGTAKSVVTLILPMVAQKLQFSKPSYEMKYTEKDSKGELTSSENIALTADIKSETKCTLEGDYHDSFKCSVDTKKKTYKIELANEKIDLKKEDADKAHISLVLRDEVLLKDIPVNVQTSLIVNLKEVPKVEEEECSHTTWIIVTVIMAIVLVAYVVASLIYHKSKLRSV